MVYNSGHSWTKINMPVNIQWDLWPQMLTTLVLWHILKAKLRKMPVFPWSFQKWHSLLVPISTGISIPLSSFRWNLLQLFFPTAGHTGCAFTWLLYAGLDSFVHVRRGKKCVKYVTHNASELMGNTSGEPKPSQGQKGICPVLRSTENCQHWK